MMNKKAISLFLWFFLILSSIQPISALSQTKAEKLNQLGLLLNISEAELAADLSREVGLTMILKALGYSQAEADAYESTSPFQDTERWSKGWASLAYHLKITTGTSGTTFSPTKPLSEREFLTFLLRALGHDPSVAYAKTESLSKEYGILGMNESIGSSGYTKQEASIAMYNSLSSTYLPEEIPLANLLMDKGLFDLSEAVSVGLKEGNLEILRIKVLSPHEFKVVFNQPVETNKITFLLENDMSSYGAMATWNASKDVATIVTANDMRNGAYTLIANYLSTQVLTYKQVFKVMSSTEENIVIVNDGLSLSDDGYLIAYVSDANGTPLYNKELEITAKNLASNTSLTLNKVRDRYYVLSDIASTSSRLGDRVEVTVTYRGDSLTKEVEIREASGLEDFDFINPLVNNGRLRANLSNALIDYTGITESGHAYILPFHTSNMDGRNNFETIGDLTFYSSNGAVLDVDSLKVDLQGNLRGNIGSIGSTVLSAQNNISGEIYSITITVYADAEISLVTLETSGDIVALGEKNDLSAVAYDQFGAQMDFNYVSGLRYVSSDEEVIPLSNMKLMNNTFTYTGAKEGTSMVSVFSKENRLLFSLALRIEGAPEPIGIIGVDIPKYFEASTSAEYRLTYEDIHVIDQFDRAYDLDINDEAINISHEAETDDVMNFGSNQVLGGGLAVKATTTVGKGSYTFTVEDIAYAVIVKEFETIHADDIASYEIDDIEEMEIGLLNQEMITLRGLTDSEDEIVLGTDHIDFVTLSDTSIAETTIDGNKVTVKGLEGGTATLSIWKDGKIIAESTITVLPDDDE